MNLHDLVVPGVRSLQPYQPGKPVEELERELGIQGIAKKPFSDGSYCYKTSTGLCKQDDRYTKKAQFICKGIFCSVFSLSCCLGSMQH